MRFLTAIFLTAVVMFTGASAQQANAPDSQNQQAPQNKAKQKKTTAAQPEKPNVEEKPPQSSEQSSTPKTPSEQPKTEPSKETSAEKDKEEKDEHYDLTEVPPVVTHHQITVDGRVLKYTATAGRLPIKRGDGKIEAEMFFVAYALEGQNAATRPLTFAFNGGPGSASIWLHMGALGPKKVVLNPD